MSRNLAAAGWFLALAAALWLGAGVLLFGHPAAMAAGPLGDGSTLEWAPVREVEAREHGPSED